jgi:MFS family permease
MIQLIILLGIVSFFADVAYEGARSIIGPFFALLGASGAAVGTFAGLAEFAGYGIRIVSGVLADKSKNYWLLTAIGYLCNLIVIPLFALAGSWQMAALLLVLERSGKALRTPSRDAMLSYACKQVGRGWGFGLHEAFDRCGGLLGPLIMFFTLSTGPHFKIAFAILAIPAAFALAALYTTYKKFPHPEVAEPSKQTFSLKNFSRPFWIFLASAALVGAGTLDFALVAYHLQKQSLIATASIPLFYMGSIAVSALFALIGGKWFDLAPKSSLYFGIVAGSLSPLFLFLGASIELWIGIVLWGIGMGTQAALFRSVLAHLIPPQQRSTGYGIFGVVFGLAWFLGSALIGKLYDTTLAFSAITSLALQLLSIPFIRKLSIRNRNSNAP